VKVLNEPLIDINGDGKPDNFDFLKTGRSQFISLMGTDKPALDIDGDGILDIDINADNIPDKVVDDGRGNPVYFIVDKDGAARPVSDQGLAMSAWNSNSTDLSLSWPIPSSTGDVTGYQLAVGESFEKYDSFSFGWKSAGLVSSGTVTGLALPVPKITRLTQPFGPSDPSFFVEDATRYFNQGRLAIGSEIVGALRVSNTEFQVLSGQTGCPGTTGRGCSGTLPSQHLPGEIVSDGLVLASVRGITGPPSAPTGYVPSEAGRPLVVYRIDATPPGAPPTVRPQVPPGQPSGSSFVVAWDASNDNESGVMVYEVQERTGTDPVWKSLGAITAVKTGGVVNNSYQVGNPASNPSEAPRKSGLFLSYRVRSYNYAGLASVWSAESASVATTVITSVIGEVSNYPNPFDTRKGGPYGKTVITYELGADSDATITIYDLLGYVVRTFKFNPGEMGGRLGSNRIEWDGKNGMGRLVSKGGYIARIKVGSNLGTATAIRKIGVIH
jgi:hypothetical protein